MRPIQKLAIGLLAVAEFGLRPNIVAAKPAVITSPGLLPPPKEQPWVDRRIRNVPQQQESPPEVADEPLGDPGPPIEQGGTLNLMCIGGGGANKEDVTTAYVWGTYGSASGTAVSRRSQGFDDQVSLHMTATEGRLRMPRVMLPTIRGGENGWFKIHDIKITPGEITGSIGVNFINNPKVRLDRYSGAISISGKAGDYTGRCRRFDPERTQRQF